MSLGSDTQSGFDPSVDSSVGVNTLQAEPLESQGLVPRRGSNFSLLRSMQKGYEDYLPSYPKGTSNSYSDGKQLGMKLQSRLCSGMAEVKNVWSYTSPVPYILVAQCLN
jgi:hypothetical protein